MTSSPKKTNILIFSQWYFPEKGNRLRELADRLIQDGFHVEVLTAVPYSLYNGKICSGYKIRFRQTEYENNGQIKVVRLPLYINQTTSGLKRMLCYFSFSLAASTIGQFGLSRPDIIFCYNLPTLGFPAKLFRFFRKTKIVLMIQDLWPESVTNSGMMNNHFLHRVLAGWCRRFYRSADALTGLSPGFKTNLIEKGVPDSKIEVVYNWSDEIPLPALAPSESVDAENSEKKRPFTFLYAGNMGIFQGLDTLLDAAKILMDRGANIRFKLIGEGVVIDSLKKKASELQLTNLEFFPRIPSDKINEELVRADALFLHLKKLEMFRVTIPGKTQAYLYAGRPILSGVDGEVKRIIQEANAGLTFEPENPESLADAAEKMSRLSPEELQKMGESGKEYYAKKMSLEVGYQTIAQLFQRLMTR